MTGSSVRGTLARTPPMGWMSWNAFGRDLSEAAVLDQAEAIVSSGLRDAGYEYVCLDDHWQGGRGPDGRLFPNAERFPNGIQALAEHLHQLGLKLGIYTCAGPLTCGGEPGSEGFHEIDADTFAAWGVDYLKVDYCHAPPDRDAAIERYARMGAALDATGQPIVYAVCEWGGRRPWEWARGVGAQLWRTTGDVRDQWDGPGGIVTLADATEPLAEFAGPGGWNDPDMLVVGLRGSSRDIAAGTIGCTDAEYRTQMSLWAMMAAPLMVSCDLRTADEAPRGILGGAGIIAIDQDPLGQPGRRTSRIGPLDVWHRRLAGAATAVALLNRSEKRVSLELGWDAAHGAPPEVLNAWSGLPVERLPLKVELDPHGTALYRIGSEVTAEETSVKPIRAG